MYIFSRSIGFLYGRRHLYPSLNYYYYHPRSNVDRTKKWSVAHFATSIRTNADEQKKKEDGIPFDDVIKAFFEKNKENPMTMEPERYSPSQAEPPTPEKKEAAQQYYQKGEQLTKEKQYSTALSYLKLALQNNSFHLEARKLVAQCYFELKDYEESFAHWLIASRLDPQDPQLFVNIGVTLITWNDPENIKYAGHYLNKAIKMNPYWEVPYKIFADYNISQKNYSKAIQSLRTILKLNPNDAEAKRKLNEIEELQQKAISLALQDKK
jgi:tetratricopeptide (TPR) repeat protein